MSQATLITHAGASLITLDELHGLTTPPPTESWHPISHYSFVEEVKNSLTQFNFQVSNERHSVYHGASGSDRYFGVFDLVSKHDDYAIAVGLRNSHDKTFPAAMMLGSHVFVCDNLAFSGGEVKIARKHTRWIERDLPQLVYRASGNIVAAMGLQEKRIDTYKDTYITTVNEAHHIMVVSVQAGILPGRLLDDVANEWDKPRHPEFEERTYWALFNSFTEVLKQTSAVELPKRTQALHGLFDQSVGLIAAN